jgi:hypothetical protein
MKDNLSSKELESILTIIEFWQAPQQSSNGNVSFGEIPHLVQEIKNPNLYLLQGA